jgi:signal transduction histidine kinase
MKHTAKEQALMIYFVSVAAAAICFTTSAWISNISFEYRIILILLAAVLISTSLLLKLLKAPAPIGNVCTAAACACVIYFAPEGAFPMIMVSAIQIASSYLSPSAVNIAAGAVYIAWAAFTLHPLAAPNGAGAAWQETNLPPFIFAALITGFTLYSLHLLQKLEKDTERSFALIDRISELNDALSARSRSAKTTERVSRLEERNRLSARIHDEIGHGMSGSILLLEGADAIIGKDPEKARETIKYVTEHLRESTDKIRAVLREEYTDSGEVSLARIKSEIAAFESAHRGMSAELAVQGDMDSISRRIWVCIHENMTEAMTNTLKHSAATLFKVKLTNSNKLLYVEFSDNGASGRGASKSKDKDKGKNKDLESPAVASANPRSASTSDPATSPFAGNAGLGLRNMEERCALCYGRCFFRAEKGGFHVIMTFPLRGGAETDN